MALLCVGSALFSPNALADGVSYQTATPFIPFTVDATPGEEYHLGYLLDASSTIVGVYYEDTFATDPANRFKTFSIASAESGVVLLQKTSGSSTYDLLKLQIALQSDKTVNLTLDYLKNGLFGNRDSVVFGVRFNAQSALFEAFDLAGKKKILNAEAFVKYLGSQQVGIDHIQFQLASKMRARLMKRH